MACFHIHFKLHMGIPNLPSPSNYKTLWHARACPRALRLTASHCPPPSVLGTMIQKGWCITSPGGTGWGRDTDLSSHRYEFFLLLTLSWFNLCELQSPYVWNGFHYIMRSFKKVVSENFKHCKSLCKYMVWKFTYWHYHLEDTFLHVAKEWGKTMRNNKEKFREKLKKASKVPAKASDILS